MSRTFRNRHAAVAATVAVAALSWVVVTRVAGVSLVVKFPHSGPSTVALGAVVAAAATTTMAGWVSLAAMERLLARPLTAWCWLAAAVVLASLALPVVFAATFAAAVGLIAIHVAVGVTAMAGVSLSRRDVLFEAPAGLRARVARRGA